MRRDSGCNSQDTDAARLIQEVLAALRQMPPPPQWVTSPAARAA